MHRRQSVSACAHRWLDAPFGSDKLSLLPNTRTRPVHLPTNIFRPQKRPAGLAKKRPATGKMEENGVNCGEIGGEWGGVGGIGGKWAGIGGEWGENGGKWGRIGGKWGEMGDPWGAQRENGDNWGTPKNVVPVSGPPTKSAFWGFWPPHFPFFHRECKMTPDFPAFPPRSSFFPNSRDSVAVTFRFWALLRPALWEA